MAYFKREDIFPEEELPDCDELIATGRSEAVRTVVGRSPFLLQYNVKSEMEYKLRQADAGRVMMHGQIGFRSLQKSRQAYEEIYSKLEQAGYRVDRYGICLDWSMGYPRAMRAGMPRGTGLILDDEADFSLLTSSAPVAAHFGDFVMGTPAAFENTIASLKAGSTTIGNIGQYFNFRMPHWNDDVTTTSETIKALALCAAQPVDILIHSNLDDGFAALFTDLTCGIGAVLIEQYIVDELLGGKVSHCYGHTFSNPVTRLAFQRALAKVSHSPGSMVYGNTTSYGKNQVENYAVLGSYMLPDLMGQITEPTGHGLNPVPVTEALRIPDIQEIVDAHLFANRLREHADDYVQMTDFERADEIGEVLVEAGERFKLSVLEGLQQSGVDITSPFEMLLSIRRIGAKKLEELFGPGVEDQNAIRKRKPVVQATTVAELEKKAEEVSKFLSADEQDVIRNKAFRACIATTDVHEYGKVLIETVLRELDLNIIDAGVSTDPDVVADMAKENSASFVAVSTYNGIALDFLERLSKEFEERNLDLPIFIGGKLNQVKEDDDTGLPKDVTKELGNLGAIVCHTVEDLLRELIRMAQGARYG